MMIDNLKEVVISNLNKMNKFRYNGVRNQNEEFIGMITAVYPALFVIKLDNNNIRTFSYSDLLIGNLEIVD